MLFPWYESAVFCKHARKHSRLPSSIQAIDSPFSLPCANFFGKNNTQLFSLSKSAYRSSSFIYKSTEPKAWCFFHNRSEPCSASTHASIVDCLRPSKRKPCHTQKTAREFCGSSAKFSCCKLKKTDTGVPVFYYSSSFV